MCPFSSHFCYILHAFRTLAVRKSKHTLNAFCITSVELISSISLILFAVIHLVPYVVVVVVFLVFLLLLLLFVLRLPFNSTS